MSTYSEDSSLSLIIFEVVAKRQDRNQVDRSLVNTLNSKEGYLQPKMEKGRKLDLNFKSIYLREMKTDLLLYEDRVTFLKSIASLRRS